MIASAVTGATATTTSDSTTFFETSPVQLPAVEVTATRIPALVDEGTFGVEQLRARTFRNEIGISLDEALREIPGVAVSNRNNLSQGDRISIRGIGSRASFGVRGIRVLVDDVPLTMPDGQSQLNNLDLGIVEDLTVLRGPASWLYGNAAGGVIHVRTRSPGRTGVKPSLIFGSNGLQRWRLTTDYQLSDGHALTVSANRLKRDGYRNHSAALIHSVNLVGKHVLSQAVTVSSILNITDAPYLLNPSSLSRQVADSAPQSTRFFVRSQGASKRLTQGQAGMTLAALADDRQLRITLYGLVRTLDNPIPGRIIELDRRGGGLRSIFSQTLLLGSTTTRASVGFDIEGQWDERSEYANEGISNDLLDTLPPRDIIDAVVFGERSLQQDEQVLGLGPFVVLEAEVFPGGTVYAGTRYDRYRFEVTDRHLDDGTDNSGSQTMKAVSPSIGFSYSPRDATTAFFHCTTAFQTPTTVELNNRRDGAGGFNSNIKPETMRNLELGMRGFLEATNMAYSLTLFRFTLQDMLIPFQAENSGEEVFYRNAGKTSNRGVEARLAWTPSVPIRIKLSYALGNFLFDDFELDGGGPLNGKQVPGVPRNQIWSQLSYQLLGVIAQVETRHVGAYYANDFNGPPPNIDKTRGDYRNDAFTTLDVRLSWERAKPVEISLFAGVDNLLDTDYSGSVVPNAFGDRFFEPAPGRSLFVGSSLGWP